MQERPGLQQEVDYSGSQCSDLVKAKIGVSHGGGLTHFNLQVAKLAQATLHLIPVSDVLLHAAQPSRYMYSHLSMSCWSATPDSLDLTITCCKRCLTVVSVGNYMYAALKCYFHAQHSKHLEAAVRMQQTHNSMFTTQIHDTDGCVREEE